MPCIWFVGNKKIYDSSVLIGQSENFNGGTNIFIQQYCKKYDSNSLLHLLVFRFVHNLEK